MPNQIKVDDMVNDIEANEEAAKDQAPSASSGLGDHTSEARKSIDSERVIFNAAHRLLRPGAFYRYVIYLYAERKLMVAFSIHFIATIIIWGEYVAKGVIDATARVGD
jgi:hypothetical protein